MLSGVSREIYNLILNKLNENSHDVVFDGTWTFATVNNKDFKFERYKTAEGQEHELEDVVPFVDMSVVEIPYNERNKRSDYEMEYYATIPIGAINAKNPFQFDYTRPEYQALMETYEVFKHDLTYVAERENMQDVKMSFKLREPQRVNTFVHGGRYYAVFSFVPTVSTIKFGFFGNQVKVYLGKGETVEATEDNELDTTDWTSIVGKGQQDTRLTNQELRTYDVVDTGWEAEFTVNYNDKDIDDTLYHEALADVEKNNQIYAMRIVKDNEIDITRKVRLFNLNVNHQNNVPVIISFTAKLAKV